MPENVNHNQPAVLLVGRGNRRAAGVAEFQQLAAQLQAALPQRTCLAGFLELIEPSAASCLEKLRRQGFQNITVLPVLPLAAGQIKNDLPTLLRTFQEKYPEMRCTLSADLGIHAHLLQVASERITSAESACGLDYERAQTLLMVVGHGSADADANANISKIARILWETLGFAWAETAYLSVAAPLVSDALEFTHRLGLQRVLVFPYLLFNGPLVEQLQEAVSDYQAQHPETTAVLAPYLNAHPLVVATLVERLAEAEAGQAPTGCQVCSKDTLVATDAQPAAPAAVLQHSPN